MKNFSVLLAALWALVPGGLLATSVFATTDVNGLPEKSATKVAYNKAVFVPSLTTPRMYLASDAALSADDADKPFQLARAELATDATTGKAVVNIVGLGELPNSADAKITNMAVAPNGSFIAATTDDLKLHVVTNPAKKASEATNVLDSAVLKDANGKDIDSSPVALAASSDYIFAPVANNGKVWDYPQPETRSLVVLNKNDLSPFANSTHLYFTVDDLGLKDSLVVSSLSETLGASPTNVKTALHWDENFQRLYLGFNGLIGRDNNNASILGVGTVKIDATADPKTAIFESILRDFSMDSFEQGQPNYIIGASAEDASQISVSIPHVRTMHTSTGKDYLIVASMVSTDSNATTISGVFALPLVKDDGRLSSALPDVDNNFTDHPSVADELMRGDNGASLAALVAPNLFNEPASESSAEKVAAIADIFVEGDSVYIAMKDDADRRSTRRGLFRSSAIFANNGTIEGWTPAQRIGGNLGIVAGAGFDANTGNVYALRSEAVDGNDNNVAGKRLNTVCVSQWAADDAANLNKTLQPLFPAAKGGIQRMYSFDEATPGFASVAGDAVNRTGSSAQDDFDNACFNMLVAMGCDNVALAQAGRAKSIDDSVSFLETANFENNSFDFPDNALLKDLAPLTCCELSKHDYATASEAMGYLFVGGVKGVAVLSGAGNGSTQAGNGFTGRTNTSGGLIQLSNIPAGFPGQTGDPTTSNYVFRKLVPSNGADFSFTRKIACLADRAYVVTATYVYVITIAADGSQFDGAGFAGAGSIDLNEIKLNFAGTPLANAVFTDCVVLKNAGFGDPANHTLLLGTDRGLFIVVVPAGYDGTAVVDCALVAVDPASPVASDQAYVAGLSFVGNAKGPFSSFGNLFVLYGDPAVVPAAGVVKRFYVKTIEDYINDRVRLIGGAAEVAGVNSFTVDEFRTSVFADGSAFYTTRGKHFDAEANVAGRVIRSSTNTSKPAALSSVAQKAVADASWNSIAAPIINPATGQVLLAGTAGVVVN
jgi:hypothetical protein